MAFAYACIAAFYLFWLRTILAQRSEAHRRKELALGIGLGLLLLGNIVDVVNDIVHLRSIYIQEYCFLGLVLVMGYALSLEFRMKSLALENAVKELRESTEKHERLVDNLVGAFIYCRTAGGAFTYISSSIRRVLGYSPDEFSSEFAKYMRGRARPCRSLAAGSADRGGRGASAL